MARHEVTYVGPGTRIISKSDWASVGVDSPMTTWTSLAVGHQPSLVIEGMSDEQMFYLTVTEKDSFKVKEIVETPAQTPAPDETPDETGASEPATLSRRGR